MQIHEIKRFDGLSQANMDVFSFLLLLIDR